MSAFTLILYYHEVSLMQFPSYHLIFNWFPYKKQRKKSFFAIIATHFNSINGGKKIVSIKLKRFVYIPKFAAHGIIFALFLSNDSKYF